MTKYIIQAAAKDYSERDRLLAELVAALESLIETAGDLLDCDTGSESAITEHAYARDEIKRARAALAKHANGEA